jgi:hypothetical protein
MPVCIPDHTLTVCGAIKGEIMSNKAERKAVESHIVNSYKDVKLILKEAGMSLDTGWSHWPLGAQLAHSAYAAVGIIVAYNLGMGQYSYDRCERVINGLQYSTELI